MIPANGAPHDLEARDALRSLSFAQRRARDNSNQIGASPNCRPSTTFTRSISMSAASRVPRLAANVIGARLANPGFGQGLFHSCRFNPGALEKCFRLFVTSVERSEMACDAISKSILPIGVPACSRANRSRA
jgi:hypothetical protein